MRVLDAAGRTLRQERSDTSARTEWAYTALDQVSQVRRPDGGTVDVNYETTGEVEEISGAGTAPQRFQYDPRGLMTTMKTYQGGLGGTPVLTTWEHDNHSGRLKKKKINLITVEEYDYTTAGRIDEVTRHLNGGTTVVTSYGRDPATGRLTGVTHSNGDAGASMTHDDQGRLATVTDGTGVRTYTYNAQGQVTGVTVPQVAGASLAYTYDTIGRRTGLTLMVGATAQVLNTWTYDAAGRLATVSDGTHTVTYGYLAGSDLVATATGGDGTSDLVSTTFGYDTQDRLVSLSAADATDPLAIFAAYTYTSNDIGLRTRTDVTLADPQAPTAPQEFYWAYAYDALDQVAEADCRWTADDSLLPGREFRYDFDSISNRVRTGRLDGTGLPEEQYTVNDMNQYTVRVVPGAVHITGFADPAAAVTVNDAATTRNGAAFHVRLPVDNTLGPVEEAITITAVSYDAVAEENVIAEDTATIQIPAASELITTSLEGATEEDSRWHWEWDAQGRLLSVTPKSPSTETRKLAFSYDYEGHRVSKAIYGWSGAAWVLEQELRFVYDGWLLLAEFDVTGATPELVRSYMWGLDLAGLRTGVPGQDAGGIGGLLAVTNHGTAPATHLTVSDGNGNVTALIDAATGGVAETIEYSPFGKIMGRHTVAGAVPLDAPLTCPLLFSTKYLDIESELLYFGYRYYTSETGRWLCRDPLGEQGGANLYAYCQNDPINSVDPLGLEMSGKQYKKLLGQIQQIADEVSQLELPPGWRGNPGTYFHEQFAKRVTALGNPHVLTEQSINKFGDLVKKQRWLDDSGQFWSRWPRGSRRPDVMILEDALEEVVKRGKNVRGRVLGVVDLKTGGAVLDDKWVRDVAGRLGMYSDDILMVSRGTDLVASARFMRQARRLVPRLPSGVVRRVGGRAVLVGAVLLAYSDAKARGMEPNAAKAYAASAVVGGDVIYDVTDYVADMYWLGAANFAANCPAGQASDILKQAVLLQDFTHGTPADVSDRKLDALLKSHAQGVGGNFY